MINLLHELLMIGGSHSFLFCRGGGCMVNAFHVLLLSLCNEMGQQLCLVVDLFLVDAVAVWMFRLVTLLLLWFL
jgi:hypothetical protein